MLGENETLLLTFSKLWSNKEVHCGVASISLDEVPTLCNADLVVA